MCERQFVVAAVAVALKWQLRYILFYPVERIINNDKNRKNVRHISIAFELILAIIILNLFLCYFAPVIIYSFVERFSFFFGFVYRLFPTLLTKTNTFDESLDISYLCIVDSSTQNLTILNWKFFDWYIYLHCIGNYISRFCLLSISFNIIWFYRKKPKQLLNTPEKYERAKWFEWRWKLCIGLFSLIFWLNCIWKLLCLFLYWLLNFL